MRTHSSAVLSPIVLGSLLAAAFAAQAQNVLRPESPLAIPTFTCSDVTTPLTTGALANPGTVLNTTAVSATDRGNQVRWAYAYDPTNEGAHTAPAATLGVTETIPAAYIVAGTVTSAPADLSGLPTLGWQHFSGREVFAYVGGAGTVTNPNLANANSLDSVGFFRNNPLVAGTTNSLPNQIRYFRYQFYLAPEVDPTAYTLTLQNAWADDSLLNIYLNGAGAGLTAAAGPRDIALGGTSTTAKWQTGLNTLTVAVFDGSPSATRLRIPGATSSSCAANLRTLALTVGVNAASITTANAATFTGQATAAGGGIVQPLPVGTPVTLTLTGPSGFTETLTTTVTGADGSFTFTRAAGLPVGNYTVAASLVNQPAIVAAPANFTVSASTTANVQAVPTLGGGALALLGAALGALGMRQRTRRRGGARE